MLRPLSVAASAASVLLGLAGLAINTSAALDREATDRFTRLPRRYWEDVYLAVGQRLTGRFPVSYEPWRSVRTAEGRRPTEARPVLTKAVAASELQPWQPWRSIPLEAFQRRQPPSLRERYDDAGRPLLLAMGFALLGGVSPFLIFWLGFLCAAPVLLWGAFELRAAGRPVAALLLAPLLAASPFIGELLALAYSALAFYILALIVLALVSVWATAGPVSRCGFLARAAASGLALGVATLCRASTLMVMPAIALAFALAARRGFPRGRRWRSFAIALVLLGAPFLALRVAVDHEISRTVMAQSQGRVAPPMHPVWHGIWIGLGDFDRSKGYRFDDFAAFDAAVNAGGSRSTTTSYDVRNESLLRDMILRDIADDPAWFLGILGRRLVQTMGQLKLWPRLVADGADFAPAIHANEGLVDAYYRLTTTADWVGIGSRRFEAPIPLLWAPALLLLLTAVLQARGPLASARGIRADVLALLLVALGALANPVLITTASALESEGFVVVYLLGAALLPDATLRLRWEALTGRERPTSARNSS